MHVVQVNAAWDAPLATPEALIARYDTLAAWGTALVAAGGARASVVQRFAHDAERAPGELRFFFVRDGARPFPRPWARLRRLAQAVSACAPDVVHVNGLLFPAATRELRRRLPRSAALVVQDHASSGPPRGAARRLLWRWGLRGVDAFFFTAAAQAAPWRAAGVLPVAASVVCVPEASRTITPVPRAAAREGSRLRGDPAVLWVGHLDANKDPLTVLEGFAAALAALPDAVLTFVFRGDALRAALQACLAAAPVLRAHVELRGAVEPDELPALYSAADVFVLGSHREGSGYALLEAMACGALPVVTDIPAFRALTADGTLGATHALPPLLWSAGDARALCRTLVPAALLTRQAAPERDACRALVRAHFERELSWPAVAARARAAYRVALAARRRAPGASA